MDVLINIFCKNCHKPSRIMLKKGETHQMIEKNYPCPRCNVKGKIVVA